MNKKIILLLICFLIIAGISYAAPVGNPYLTWETKSYTETYYTWRCDGLNEGKNSEMCLFAKSEIIVSPEESSEESAVVETDKEISKEGETEEKRGFGKFLIILFSGIIVGVIVYLIFIRKRFHVNSEFN